MRRLESNSARRRCLTTLSGMGGAALLDSPPLRSAEIDPRVAQIVSDTIAIDMHSHVQVRLGQSAAGSKPVGSLNLADEVKRAGFSAICQTWAVDGTSASAPGEYYKRLLEGMAFEDQLLAANRM